MPIKTFLSPIATFASSGAQSLVVGNPGENGQIILWSSPPLGLQPFSKSFPPGILKVWERRDFSREWCHIWETYVRCFGRSRSNWVPVLSQRPPWKYPCSELDKKGRHSVGVKCTVDRCRILKVLSRGALRRRRRYLWQCRPPWIYSVGNIKQWSQTKQTFTTILRK